MDILKKRKRRLIISGLAGIIAASSALTGCSSDRREFAGADGYVNNNRDNNVSNGFVEEVGDGIKHGAENAATVIKGARDGARSGINDLRR